MTFTYETSRDNTPSVEAAVRGDSDIVTTIITITEDGSNVTADDSNTNDDVIGDVDDNNDGFDPGLASL